MKQLIYLLNEFVDSFNISETIATELGLNESNKNYEVSTYIVEGLAYCEIKFDHENKRGWANPTDMSLTNKEKIKSKIRKIKEFESDIIED